MADHVDDYSAFVEQEHMFMGLEDPYGRIRMGTVSMLRAQVPETMVDAIITYDKPKFLTLGRKVTRWFKQKVIVTHSGFCVRAKLLVRERDGAEPANVDAVLTFMYSGVDQSEQAARHFIDLGDDVERGFSHEVFEQRFMEFRVEKAR